MTGTIYPPKARTRLWVHITEGARAGELRLQHCKNCATVQYPPRELCGDCLSPALEWRATNGAARVLSHVSLNASVEPWFQARLPVNIALVKLDAGPVAYIFTEGSVSTGDRVAVEAKIDPSGEAVLVRRTLP